MADLLPPRVLVVPGDPDVEVRLLKPEGALRGVMLHIHPGGFIQGSAAMGDDFNSQVARSLSVATVSVEYRLAPANPHPAALEDCLTVARWLIENSQREFGTERLLIGGESAGAALTSLTLLALRDRDDSAARFSAVNVVVGGFDFSMTPSQRASTEHHFLTPERLRDTREGAFPGRSLEELRDPGISALYADLRDLPPAIFTVGTGDVMLDDTLFMSARWQAAGNITRLELWPDADHVFLGDGSERSAEARRRIIAFLSDHL